MNPSPQSLRDKMQDENTRYFIEKVARKLRAVSQEYGESVLQGCSIVSETRGLPFVCGYHHYWSPVMVGKSAEGSKNALSKPIIAENESHKHYFSCLQEAADYFNSQRGSIHNAVYKKKMQTLYGFKWRHATRQEKINAKH